MKKVTTGKILFCLTIALRPGGTTLTRPTVIFFLRVVACACFRGFSHSLIPNFRFQIPNLVWRKQIANRKSAIENFPLALLSDV